MTADGKIAMPDGARLTISSEDDFARVHRLRNSCDAILVGINTILLDDPSLLVKDTFIKNPRHPLRIVLDSKGRIPAKATVLDNRSKTLIAVTKTKESMVLRKLGNKKNIEVKAFGKGKVDLKGLLAHLVKRGVRSLMVEGGGETIWSFLQGGFVDEMTIFVGNMVVGGRGPTPASGEGARKPTQAVTMVLVSVQRMPGGVLLRYRPRNKR
jgi:2,5-diamino-6-(ribosylamino)-4(3H)-pyrimidinone 5'-phosphate reductase